jgi:hypothetical protein
MIANLGVDCHSYCGTAIGADFGEPGCFDVLAGAGNQPFSDRSSITVEKNIDQMVKIRRQMAHSVTGGK